ncbi:MAG: hypothetical protein ACE5F4_01510 [Candidatus Paceibacteria bacterium]
MGNIFKRYKNLITIGVVILIAFVAYSMFFTAAPRSALTTSNVSATQSAVEQELLSLLLELRDIELDPALFSDERFQSLQDFNQEIVAEPVGRTNPFAPLGQ